MFNASKNLCTSFHLQRNVVTPSTLVRYDTKKNKRSSALTTLFPKTVISPVDGVYLLRSAHKTCRRWTGKIASFPLTCITMLKFSRSFPQRSRLQSENTSLFKSRCVQLFLEPLLSVVYLEQHSCRLFRPIAPAEKLNKLRSCCGKHPAPSGRRTATYPPPASVNPFELTTP